MVNNCMFIGRLGRDPESRFTQSGKTVVNFSIACSEKRGGVLFSRGDFEKVRLAIKLAMEG